MLIFKFLRYCLDIADFTHQLSKKEWDDIYFFCLQQALLGIGFEGAEKVSQDHKPPKELLLQWFAICKQIENRNIQLNKRCLEIQKEFQEAGFTTCILKGQGNALMYPNPLLRQSGDIDIWVGGRIKDVLGFLHKTYPSLDIGYHHTELPRNEVDIEVHYRPTWFCSPLRNYRLQKWFKKESVKQLKKNIETLNVPDMAFNTIYQLAHIFNHFIQEGVGLRQIIDYYYVLQNRKQEDVVPLLRSLGLIKFAGALMYVMKEVFWLPKDKLLCTPNNKEGEFLLSEILESGNFGQHDSRNAKLLQQKGIRRKLYQAKHSIRYFRSYPEEVLCYPFRFYHIIWRELQLWRW